MSPLYGDVQTNSQTAPGLTRTLVGHLHAEYRALRLIVEPSDSALVVDVDPQLLTSAVLNLLKNAFKFT